MATAEELAVRGVEARLGSQNVQGQEKPEHKMRITLESITLYNTASVNQLPDVWESVYK